MFERFSTPARESVVRTQQVARSLGSRRIDSLHLLLTILEDRTDVTGALRSTGADPTRLARDLRVEVRRSGLDGEALAVLGIDLDTVLEQTDRVFGADALIRAGTPAGHIPFARDAKKSLENALREAVRLKQRTLDTRHLFLGLVRGDSASRLWLVAQGVDVRAVSEVLEAPSAASA